MPDVLHRTPSLTISVSGASVWLCIAHGPADLPLHLEVSGEALAGLVVAVQRAWRRAGELSGRRRDQAEAARARWAAEQRRRRSKLMVVGKGAGNG